MTTPARRRILIVDDQPANIEVLVSTLEEDHELFFATTGARALQVVAGNRIDLVLLDVLMPEMDGYEVCRRLKSDDETRNVPVIFVTGLGEVDDETTGFDVGGVDYITKPISPAIVRARVRTHIELKEQRDLLSSMASTDALTGIPNRRHLDRLLEEEWQRAIDGETAFTVMLLDVDHFKQFNDTYGHARGDECLRAIARVLRTSFRPGVDLVARYGGEEFAAVLPGLEPAAVTVSVGGFLRGIEGLAIPHSASRTARHVTVSVGAVSMKARRSQAPVELLQAADELLYRAKESGRNRAIHLDRDREVHRVIVPAGESSPTSREPA